MLPSTTEDGFSLDDQAVAGAPPLHLGSGFWDDSLRSGSEASA